MISAVGVRPPPNERLASFAPLSAVGCCALAWLLTGRAVAVPLAAVGIVSAAAGHFDARTQRIPNRLVAAGLIGLAAGVVVTGLGDHRSGSELATAMSLGVLVSGAPFLAALWIVRPGSIGAGDVKLLAVQGAAIGLLAPLAAVVVLLGGWAVGGGLMAVRRQRLAPMGPGFAVGFVGAVVAGVCANTLFGGMYG